MSTVKVLDSRKRWSMDKTRQNKYDMHIEYAVDGERGYFVVVPEEEATPDRVQREVEKAEQERQAVTRLEFEV